MIQELLPLIRMDRTKVHEQVDADALAFFRKTLAAPPSGHSSS